MSGNNVFLEIETAGGRSLDWFPNAAEARRGVLAACRRMGCVWRGNGDAGELLRINGGRSIARYRIGVDQ